MKKEFFYIKTYNPETNSEEFVGRFSLDGAKKTMNKLSSEFGHMVDEKYPRYWMIDNLHNIVAKSTDGVALVDESLADKMTRMDIIGEIKVLLKSAKSLPGLKTSFGGSLIVKGKSLHVLDITPLKEYHKQLGDLRKFSRPATKGVKLK
jgi:hypothetical protein